MNYGDQTHRNCCKHLNYLIGVKIKKKYRLFRWNFIYLKKIKVLIDSSNWIRIKKMNEMKQRIRLGSNDNHEKEENFRNNVERFRFWPKRMRNWRNDLSNQHLVRINTDIFFKLGYIEKEIPPRISYGMWRSITENDYTFDENKLN